MNFFLKLSFIFMFIHLKLSRHALMKFFQGLWDMRVGPPILLVLAPYNKFCHFLHHNTVSVALLHR